MTEEKIQFKFRSPEITEIAKTQMQFCMAIENIMMDYATQMAEMEKSKNIAYQERDKLVAALSKIALAFHCKAGLARHSEEDTEWEDDWRNIVFIETPLGEQMSWHIHDSELPLFEHLDFYDKKWDGHTTEEKYQRLENIDWEYEVLEEQRYGKDH